MSMSSFRIGNIAAKNFGYTTVSAEAHKKLGKSANFVTTWVVQY